MLQRYFYLLTFAWTDCVIFETTNPNAFLKQIYVYAYLKKKKSDYGCIVHCKRGSAYFLCQRQTNCCTKCRISFYSGGNDNLRFGGSYNPMCLYIMVFTMV